MKPKADKKILIIDDESDTRVLLRRALMNNDYFVNDAENMKKGLEMNSNLSHDIIILDVNLPDANGMQNAYKLKNNNNVIILISADNDQLITNFKDFGADGFLKKPFTTDELLSTLQSISSKI